MTYKNWLLKKYYDYREYIPIAWLYHADYFHVRQLLAGAADEMEQEAARRLRHVLSVAVASVPFYRRSVKLSAAELANEPPRELLQRFPYIDKGQVMACQRDFLHERLNPRRLNYATSEGSTGQGIGVWRTKRMADIEKAFYTHEWGKFGFTFDKTRYLRMGADARALVHESAVHVSGNRLMLSPSHISERHRAAIVDAINRFRPQFIHAYPSAAATLSELLRPGDLDLQVRAVLLASEPATPRQLAAIAQRFDCPISLSYGLTERTNLAFTSYQHGACGPYLFHPLYGASENRWNAGRAEIVGTSCWNDVMPLIRYCTDDFGAIDEHGKCPAIDGRHQEFLFDRSGHPIPGMAIVVDSETWNFVRHYQIRQKKPGEITISVVARKGSLSPDQKKFLLDAQVQRWGGFFDIAVNEVADIPLSPGGKRQFVINELQRPESAG